MPGSGLYTFENMAVTLQSVLGPQPGRMVLPVLLKEDLAVEQDFVCLVPRKQGI
jgi:hypothetical protein